MSSAPTKLFDAFDRGNGNGSSRAEDDWLDQISIFQNEWGSTAATTFNPADTDANDNQLSEQKQRRFERLYELHNGKGESSRKDTIRQSHVLNDAKTFMSVLDMPTTQRERVLRILDDLDISSNNFGSRKYEKIILCICSLVSDEALTRRLEEKKNPSVDNRLLFRREFRDLMDATKMSNSEHRKIREQIRNRSKHF